MSDTQLDPRPDAPTEPAPGSTIRDARPDDLPAVLDLISRAGLPLDGVAEGFGTFVVAERQGRIVGTAGVELYGEGALLRSVAVDPELRGRRIGAELVERALDVAARAGARAAYLLTTTAEDYFPRHGFVRVGREEVPAAVKGSVEFRGACPASAVAMARRLDPGPAEGRGDAD